MSHRIAIYRDCTITRLGDASEFTPESIMHELTGANTEEGAVPCTC